MSIGKAHLPAAKQIRNELFAELIGNGAAAGGAPVVGVGVSPATIRRHEAKPFVLEVYLGGDVAPSNPSADINPRFQGMDVRPVWLGGTPTLLYGAPRGRRFEELCAGCSVSLAAGPAATLGCFMSDGEQLYFITAAHALRGTHPSGEEVPNLALANRRVYQAAIGLPVVDPKAPPREIGTVVKLSDVFHLQPGGPEEINDHDVALVQLDPDVAWTLRLRGLGMPSSGSAIDPPFGRMRAKKLGQHTGLTESHQLRRAYGRIRAEDATRQTQIDYSDLRLFFGRNKSERFAGKGDSGAVVWNNDKQIVGMVVAATPRVVSVLPWESIDLFLRSNADGQTSYDMGVLTTRG